MQVLLDAGQVYSYLESKDFQADDYSFTLVDSMQELKLDAE